MGRLQPFPIVGGAYADDAKSWANQDTVNYLPVRSEREGTLTAAQLEQVPGLRPFLRLGNGPVRGGRDVEGKGFVVSGTTLYLIAGDGVASAVGTIPGTGPVTITHNQVTGGNQVVIGNGISGYVYNTATGTLAQITDDGFPGFGSCDFLGQMILGMDPQRRYWFHSDLADATSYNTNNRYSAETSPDRLVGLIAAHNDAVVFGERTIEPWSFAPSANQNFQLQAGAVVEMGCAAARTICRLDNSIFFLNNSGQVVQLVGSSPRIVSTRAMEGAISRCDLSRAFAMTWEDKGHAVYYITFPDGQTWGWDAAHGEWHRRKSYGMERWRASCVFKLNGHWYAGDAFSGVLHRMTWGWAMEACKPLERIRRTGFVYQAAERFRVNRFIAEFDAGASVESVAYEWPGDAPAVVEGALPSLSLGVQVAYQYSVTPPPGRPFGMAVTGLPNGLTLHIDGRVTGALTLGEDEAPQWESSVTMFPNEWSAAAWNGSRYLLLSGFTSGPEQYETSEDGITWTARRFDDPGVGLTFPGLSNLGAIDSWFGTLFIGFNSDEVGASTDGELWFTTPVPAWLTDHASYQTACNDSVLFCTDSHTSSDKALVTDAFTVDTITLPTAGNWSVNVGVPGGGNLVTFNRGTDEALWSGDNGVTWNAATLPYVGYWACAVASGDGTIILAPADDLAPDPSSAGARSTDGGVTWQALTLPAEGYWTAGTAAGNAIVLIKQASADCYVSRDGGLTWTLTTLPNAARWSVAVNNGVGAVLISHADPVESDNVAVMSLASDITITAVDDCGSPQVHADGG